MTHTATDLQAAGVSIELGSDYSDIRESVRRICADYPGTYWRDLDERQAYPEAFVDALTEAGYLAALIPEEYGGSGLPLRAAAVILEEIHAAGCNRRRLPCADVHHGHAAAARQRGAEAQVPARDRQRRAAAAGLRRHRADHRLRHHAARRRARCATATTTSSTGRRSGPRARCIPT